MQRKPEHDDERPPSKIAAAWTAVPNQLKYLLFAFVFLVCIAISGSMDKIAPLKILEEPLKIITESVAILCAVLLGGAFERHEAARASAEIVRKAIALDRARDFADLKNAIIPGSHHHGLVGVRPGFDFESLLGGLADGDCLDICFTYHTELVTAVERNIGDLAARGIKVRLLICYDRSLETSRRFNQISDSGRIPHWSGPRTERSSAINMLSIYVRDNLPELAAKYAGFEFKVTPHLVDPPLAIVRNTSVRFANHTKFTWIGFYLLPAAVRMPAIEWRPVRMGSAETNDEDCVAVQTQLYFERRWAQSYSVAELDQRYDSGEVWKDELREAGVNYDQLKGWIVQWEGEAATIA